MNYEAVCRTAPATPGLLNIEADTMYNFKEDEFRDIERIEEDMLRIFFQN